MTAIHQDKAMPVEVVSGDLPLFSMIDHDDDA